MDDIAAVAYCGRRSEAEGDDMAVREIVKWPDPRLKAKATAPTVFDEGLRRLADDLLDTMRAAPGVGITGPHIGEAVRLVVLELTPGEVRIYVDPQVIEASDETIRHAEGSVSMPGVVEEVERAARVRVSYRDLDGGFHEAEAGGFLAVCLQHEIDQLDGRFWIERLSRLKRERAVKRWEKLRKRA